MASYKVQVGNISTEDLGLVEIDEEIAGEILLFLK